MRHRHLLHRPEVGTGQETLEAQQQEASAHALTSGGSWLIPVLQGKLAPAPVVDERRVIHRECGSLALGFDGGAHRVENRHWHPGVQADSLNDIEVDLDLLQTVFGGLVLVDGPVLSLVT